MKGKILIATIKSWNINKNAYKFKELYREKYEYDYNEKRRIIKKYFNKENVFDYIFARDVVEGLIKSRKSE